METEICRGKPTWDTNVLQGGSQPERLITSATDLVRKIIYTHQPRPPSEVAPTQGRMTSKQSQLWLSHLFPFTIFVVDIRQHKVDPAPSVSEVDRVFAVLLFVDLQREQNAITVFNDNQSNTVEASAGSPARVRANTWPDQREKHFTANSMLSYDVAFLYFVYQTKSKQRRSE